MDAYPFPTYHLQPEEAQALMKVYETVRSKYQVAFDFDLQTKLTQFACFEREAIHEQYIPLEFENTKNKFVLYFIKVGYNITNAKYAIGSTELQAWGFIKLARDYGHILVRKESMLDKMFNMIHNVEIDFEDDAEFSRKLYVVASDKTKANLLFTADFRNAIMNISLKEFIIEIFEDTLLIGNKTIIDEDYVLAFAAFLEKLPVR